MKGNRKELTIRQALRGLDNYLAERNDFDVSTGLQRFTLWMNQVSEGESHIEVAELSREKGGRSLSRLRVKKAQYRHSRLHKPRIGLLKKLAGAAVVGAVVSGVAFAVTSDVTSPVSLVTDGSEILADDFAAVQHLIRAENRRVTDSHKAFVSIVLMLPDGFAQTNSHFVRASRHELEGAYVAQYWSNHDPIGQLASNPQPLIRLLIANPGGNRWRDTVGQLVDRVDSERLAAVIAGVGLNTRVSRLAAEELARRGVPVIGSAVMNSPFSVPNYFQVAPSISDQVKAVSQVLKAAPEWRTSTSERPYKFLQVDAITDDPYSIALGAAFSEEFPGSPAHEGLSWRGSFNPANKSVSLMSTFCTRDPDAVFFAGRESDLRKFLDRIARTSCSAKNGPLTVIAGDGAGQLVNSRHTWPSSTITVLYAEPASPLSLDTGGGSISSTAIAHFRDGPNSYAALFSDGLDDGRAILSHDAVLAAVEASRRTPLRVEPITMPKAITESLQRIDAIDPIPGASGWIHYQNSRNAPSGWLPFNKAVPIIQLDSDGRQTLKRLSSALGVPPGPPGRK